MSYIRSSLSALAFIASAWPVAANAGNPDCFEQFERGRNSVIACEFSTRLTAQEQADLRRITRDVLQDANCIVSIRIGREQLEIALASEAQIFTAPAQPARCEIKTRESSMEITGAFIPRIVISGGRAIDATPGLADVKGVSTILSWPVIQYVNRSATVRDGMLTVINGYRAFRSKSASTTGPKGQ